MVDNDDALLSVYFPKSTVCLLVAGGDNYQQRLGTIQEHNLPQYIRQLPSVFIMMLLYYCSATYYYLLSKRYFILMLNLSPKV